MVHLPFTRVPTLPAIAAAVGNDVGAKALRHCFDAQSLPADMALQTRAVLPLRDLVGLFEQFARRRGDEAFGLFAARSIRPEDFGLFALYSLQAPDLEAGLDRLRQALHLHQSGSNIEIRRQGRTVSLSYKINSPLTFGRHHHAVHVLCQFKDFIAAHLGAPPRLLEVGLEAPGYGKSNELEAIFGAPLRWSCESNFLLFDQELLGASRGPLPHAQLPVTFSDLRRYAQSVPPTSAVEKVEAALRTRMEIGALTIEAVGHYLGIGVRTLQRRLADEGFAFSEIVERLRCSRAEELLTETDLPIHRISELLGYSEQAHFTRAYRRWHGRAPSQARLRATKERMLAFGA